MSLENAKRFIEAASTDPALQQQLGAARELAELVRLAVKAGSERGLPFTAEELQTSIGPLTADGGAGLSEDQLESVAGGILATTTPSEQAKTAGGSVSTSTSYTPEWFDKIFRSRT